MLWWIVVSVILAVSLGLGTLAWWWVGDQWADAERKRFSSGPKVQGPGPKVISTRPGDGAADEPSEGR